MQTVVTLPPLELLFPRTIYRFYEPSPGVSVCDWRASLSRREHNQNLLKRIGCKFTLAQQSGRDTLDCTLPGIPICTLMHIPNNPRAKGALQRAETEAITIRISDGNGRNIPADEFLRCNPSIESPLGYYFRFCKAHEEILRFQSELEKRAYNERRQVEKDMRDLIEDPIKYCLRRLQIGLGLRPDRPDDDNTDI